MPSRPLRLGTRGSPMALFQANLVRDRLQATAAAAPEIALAVIRTTGDRVQDRRLAEIGGKGLFTKELDEALLDARIDFAVHSLKDVETWLPAGIVLACVLPRDDPRDAFVSPCAPSLAALPPGAVVGTASLRRAAQVLRRRPDLCIAPIRGNADSRLKKLAAGEVDALLLALCGLQRLGVADCVTEILAPAMMLPAIGQGALAITCRDGDADMMARLAPLHCPGSAASVTAERAMLAALDGNCRTPIGGLATLDCERLSLDGLLLEPDGSAALAASIAGPIGDAAGLGTALGAELRRRAGTGFGFG